MTMQILKGLLNDFIKSLFDEGVVNDQFNEVLALKRIGEPDCVIKQIEKYFADAEKILSELSRHVDNPEVDFIKLASLAREVQDKSASIGAQKMRQACNDIIKACDEKNQNGFSQDLPLLFSEFNKTKNKLKALAQMERRIIRYDTSSQSTGSRSELATTSSGPSE